MDTQQITATYHDALLFAKKLLTNQQRRVSRVRIAQKECWLK